MTVVCLIMLQFEEEKVGGVIFVQTTQIHLHTHAYEHTHTNTKEGREIEKIKGVFISGGGGVSDLI